jgi:hypothetical protein
MRVTDLSGKEHSWNLSGYRTFNDDKRPRSNLHIRARQLLRIVYDNDTILEEVAMPGEHLYLDFYLPSRKTAFEVQGEQHFKQNAHFHKNDLDFKRSQQRDSRKRRWCELNNITLIELPFNESAQEWLNRMVS